MRRLIVFAMIACLAVGSVVAQTTCYLSAKDVIEGSAYVDSVEPVVKREATDYIKISKFLKNSGKKDKSASLSQAVGRDGDIYMNFRYCIPYQNVEVYVKSEFVGQYTVVVIDEQTSSFIRSGGNNYGGGLQGVLLKESGKWGANWKGQDGKNRKIILFDLLRPSLRGGRSLGNLLTRKELNSMLQQSFSEEELKGLAFEDVIELISQLNE